MSEIVQNIPLLVPSAQPGFSQILLSITMLAKSGSQMVVNNLKQLGHGLSNTKAVFTQDKWAEWTERLKSIIPSNIKKGVMATNVFDNIDWKKRALGTTETHHTNSILIQKYESAENLSNVSLGTDYNFERKNHWSCKGSTPVLSNFCLKRGSAKRLKYTPVKNREGRIKSSLYSLAWAQRTCLKVRLRSNLCWVLTTLTFFTNRKKSYCSRDQKNAGHHQRT